MDKKHVSSLSLLQALGLVSATFEWTELLFLEKYKQRSVSFLFESCKAGKWFHPNISVETSS